MGSAKTAFDDPGAAGEEAVALLVGFDEFIGLLSQSREIAQRGDGLGFAFAGDSLQLLAAEGVHGSFDGFHAVVGAGGE